MITVPTILAFCLKVMFSLWPAILALAIGVACLAFAKHVHNANRTLLLRAIAVLLIVAGIGGGLRGIIWQVKPLFYQTLHLTGKYELSRFTGAEISRNAIIDFVDRSSKDYAAAWLVKCDTNLVETIIRKSNKGYPDQVDFAKTEAKRLFNAAPESFEDEVFGLDYQRYEVWCLFDKDRKMAFVMVF